jgi:hypothetical protein
MIAGEIETQVNSQPKKEPIVDSLPEDKHPLSDVVRDSLVNRSPGASAPVQRQTGIGHFEGVGGTPKDDSSSSNQLDGVSRELVISGFPVKVIGEKTYDATSPILAYAQLISRVNQLLVAGVSLLGDLGVSMLLKYLPKMRPLDASVMFHSLSVYVELFNSHDDLVLHPCLRKRGDEFVTYYPTVKLLGYMYNIDEMLPRAVHFGLHLVSYAKLSTEKWSLGSSCKNKVYRKFVNVCVDILLNGVVFNSFALFPEKISKPFTWMPWDAPQKIHVHHAVAAVQLHPGRYDASNMPIPPCGNPRTDEEKLRQLRTGQEFVVMRDFELDCMMSWDKVLFYKTNRPSFFRSLVSMVATRNFLGAVMKAGEASRHDGSLKEWVKAKWDNFATIEYPPVETKTSIYGGNGLMGQLNTGNWGSWHMRVVARLYPDWSKDADVRDFSLASVPMSMSRPYRVRDEPVLPGEPGYIPLAREPVKAPAPVKSKTKPRKGDKSAKVLIDKSLKGKGPEDPDPLPLPPKPTRVVGVESALDRGTYYRVEIRQVVKDDYGRIQNIAKFAVIYGNLFHYLCNKFIGSDTSKKVLYTSANFYNVHNLPPQVRSELVGPTVEAAYMFLRCSKDMVEAEEERSFV